MLAKINDIDITEHISESSYSMNAEPQFESWQDGNYVEHRIKARERISGSFSVAVYGRNGMTAKSFIELVDEATSNNVTTMLVYVQNRAKFELIEAYVTITGTAHRELENGTALDVLEVIVEER